MINLASNWPGVHDEVGTSTLLVRTTFQAGGDMSLLSYTVPTLLHGTLSHPTPSCVAMTKKTNFAKFPGQFLHSYRLDNRGYLTATKETKLAG